MSKASDPKRPSSQEKTPLEGYLEYAVSITPETTKGSAAPPISHDDATEPHAPGIGDQPPTEPMDQTEQDRQVFSKLPIWRKRSLFVCSCALSFLLQFDMAAVTVTWPVSRQNGGPARLSVKEGR